jgi:hypothetical protein
MLQRGQATCWTLSYEARLSDEKHFGIVLNVAAGSYRNLISHVRATELVAVLQ